MNRTSIRLIWIVAIGCMMQSAFAHADDGKGKRGIQARAQLSGAQETTAPAPGLIESARITTNFRKDLSSADVKLRIKGGGNVIAAHFHCGRAGENGPVVVALFSGMTGPISFDGAEARGTITNADVAPSDCHGRPVNNIASLAFAMKEGLIYINVHTTDNFPGEVRGQMSE